MDIDRLVDQEIAWLARQENFTLNQLVSVYQDAMVEIQERMESLPPGSFTRQHLQSMGTQLDSIMAETYSQQYQRLSESARDTYEQQLYREKNHWVSLEEHFGSPAVAQQFRNFTPIVPQAAVKELLQPMGIHIYQVSTAAAEQIRMTLAKSLILGESSTVAARRLKREGYHLPKGRLQLISRMELSRARNAAKQEVIEQVNDKHPDLDLWQLIRDRIDYKANTRNHWFSWAINNTVRNVSKNDFFECHWPEIRKAKSSWSKTTGRKATETSVIWKDFSKGYRGMSVPAHYNDRGTVLPWRPAWGSMGLGEVKYPQARSAIIANQGPEYEEAKSKLNKASDKAKKIPKKIKNTGELKDSRRLRKETESDIIDLLKAPRKGSLNANINSLNDVQKEHAKSGIDTFESLVGRAMDDKPIQFISQQDFKYHPVYQELKKSGRLPGLQSKASYLRHHDLIVLGEEADDLSVLHELMHWYEDKTPEALAISVESQFKKAAAHGMDSFIEDGQSIYFVNGFHEEYAGKGYLDNGKPVMTEVLTSGAEKLYNKSRNGPLDLLLNDKEHLEAFLKGISVKWHL